MDFRKIAEHHIEILSLQGDLTGVKSPLAIYATPEDFQCIAPAHVAEMTWSEHLQLVGVMAELLQTRGAQPQLVMLEPSRYFEWLGDRENTPNAHGNPYASRRFSGWMPCDHIADGTRLMECTRVRSRLRRLMGNWTACLGSERTIFELAINFPFQLYGG